ncbi:sterile alpha motif domain-containing protein 9-like [Toxotes jaculatrix]|uniref:sterile alpha motif domain-containing protein 9-like n=1 Tax=Toxotes jaculatrix TaxID=941984 RepID=UPI001B3AED14|nr:sterile alpha motif domain-containing protein 9-like [Toxotes jaculatrix]
MERSTPEAEAPGVRDEASDVVGGEEVAAEEQEVPENVSQYVQQNPDSPNTRLFSFLALLKSYVPESYLLMSECQQILGPPDPIHGGPPFEERMEPFTDLISTSNPRPDHVCMIKTKCAQRAVELLADLGIFRSTTMKNFMISLCGDQAKQDVIQFIKDLLTKREMGEKMAKSKFSRLIEDIMKHENFHNAVSVLKTASDKFRENPIFPQTISRLYYITRGHTDYEAAEDWAKKAIKRAPSNSFVADTLGQVYKNGLQRAQQEGDILNMAEKAFRAFRDEERKAENEEDPELQGTAGTDSFSVFFNNRSLFGFIQVAKIAFEKKLKAEQRRSLIRKYQDEVGHKFDFFEWYLTYSKPVKISEPHYFWNDVTSCYNYYTERTAAESTSFPGLLDCLNHGLFTSKGRHAGLKEDEKTVSDLEEIRNVLKTTYEENADDVNMAERYILSNIILSNKMPDSPQLTPLEELQAIIRRFLGTEERRRGPEFCLLVLLLFWPEEQPQVVQEENDEEVEQKATEDDGSEDKTWEDEDSNEEQETRGDTAQLHHGPMFDPDLQQYVTFMEKAFDRAKYAKYLRGRYLLPLFFLGKGSGLSKWIHKSRLDAIVERNVDAALDDERLGWINDMWISGEVWQLPEIQDMLLPVSLMPQEHEEQEVIVRVGEKRIKASVEQESPVRSPKLFYLGFTIKGPVVFRVGVSHMSGQ